VDRVRERRYCMGGNGATAKRRHHELVSTVPLLARRTTGPGLPRLNAYSASAERGGRTALAV
jgi:hypothetical protein